MLDNMTGREFMSLFRGRSFDRSLSAPMNISSDQRRVATTNVLVYNATDELFKVSPTTDDVLMIEKIPRSGPIYRQLLVRNIFDSTIKSSIALLFSFFFR